MGLKAVSGGGITAASTAIPSARNRMRIIGQNVNPLAVADSVATGSQVPLSCTTRTYYQTIGPVSQVRAIIFNNLPQVGLGAETPGNNFNIERLSIEYPLGSVSSQLSAYGNTTMLNDPNGLGVITDTAGVAIPAATQFAARRFTRAVSPPTSPTAALAALGSLTVSTAYYYFITTIEPNGIESGPTASVTVTPTTGNQSAVLTWTRNSFAERYRIYRSTTNTASSATLLVTVLDPAATYTDTGTLTLVSGVNPPAAATITLNYNLPATDSTNLVTYGGNGSDVTGSTGAISGNSGGNTSVYGAQPATLIGDDFTTASVLGLGDSNMNGTGIYINNGVYSPCYSNWFQVAVNGQFNSCNASEPGSTVLQFSQNTASFSVRLRMLLTEYCDYVFTNLGINDIGAGATWQQVAQRHISFGQYLSDRGVRQVISTLPPYVVSTDNVLTVANQTPAANNTARINFNTWVRAGMLVSGSTPVLTGGTPTPYIYSWIEDAGPLEVNASNVVTLNGGYYLVPSSALYTGQVASGTPTTTSLPCATSSFTANALYGMVVKMTSGAANGQVALISANTSNALTLYANGTSSPTGITTAIFAGLTIAPSAGDTFSIYAVYTYDGVHPSYSGDQYRGTGLQSTFKALFV
jgi:lysophospholipase L1-like esterase